MTRVMRLPYLRHFFRASQGSAQHLSETPRNGQAPVTETGRKKIPEPRFDQFKSQSPRVGLDTGWFPNPFRGRLLQKPNSSESCGATETEQRRIVDAVALYYNWPLDVPDVHPRELLYNYMRCGDDIHLTRKQAMELIRWIRLPPDILRRAAAIHNQTIKVDLMLPEKALYSGTLGNYNQKIEGTIVPDTNLGWVFRGTLSYRDMYDFNPANYRDAGQENDVTWARENIPGQPFEIVAKPIPIVITPLGITYENEQGDAVEYVRFKRTLPRPPSGGGLQLVP